MGSKAVTRAGHWFIPATLGATLLQNYADLRAILEGGALALYSYEGPLIFKLLKDMTYFFIVVACIHEAVKRRRAPVRDLSWALLLIVALLFVISWATHGGVIAAIGLRWVLPLLLFFLMGDWVQAFDRPRASQWMATGIVVCLLAQVLELFFMPPVYGEILPGISARTPGIFLAPNSAAFFGCTCAACIVALGSSSRRQEGFALLGALAISALAQSGTGLVVALVLMLRHAVRGNAWVFWPLALLLVGVAMPNLDLLTQREDYVELSGGGRLEVLLQIAQDSATQIHNFGLYTNAANLRSANPEDQVAADSLVASWIGNFGALSLLMLALSLLFVACRVPHQNWSRAAPSVIVFALFAMTSIVFEAYPMNIYLSIGFWAAQRARSPAVPGVPQ